MDEVGELQRRVQKLEAALLCARGRLEELGRELSIDGRHALAAMLHRWAADCLAIEDEGPTGLKEKRDGRG